MKAISFQFSDFGIFYKSYCHLQILETDITFSEGNITCITRYGTFWGAGVGLEVNEPRFFSETFAG